jgi:hypothetical protein
LGLTFGAVVITPQAPANRSRIYRRSGSMNDFISPNLNQLTHRDFMAEPKGCKSSAMEAEDQVSLIPTVTFPLAYRW